jgi:hypothetical protein
MAPFCGKLRIHPLAKPVLLLAPAQPFSHENLIQATAFHADAVALRQIRRQAIQRPRRVGQSQFLRTLQRGGDDLADLLAAVGRRPAATRMIPQSSDPALLETMQLRGNVLHRRSFQRQHEAWSARKWSSWRCPRPCQSCDRAPLFLTRRSQLQPSSHEALPCRRSSYYH